MAPDPQAAVDNFREWQFAGGKFQGPQQVLPLAKFSEGSNRLHNLKNYTQRKFLRWEQQRVGINLGYTDDATEGTAHRVARWFLARSGGGGKPIVYGEPLAMGYGIAPSFYRYEVRTFGVNIGNTAKPTYEWRLVGPAGSAGTPVMTGQWLAIFNDTEGQFLVHFNRNAGGDLGWPDSQRWGEQWATYAKDALVKAGKAYVKSYVGL